MGKELAIRADNYSAVEDILIKMMGKYQRGIKEILDTDALAMGACDMQYFPEEYFGGVPTYAEFLSQLKKVLPNAERHIKYIEAETLGSKYEEDLRKIYEMPTNKMDGSETKRFNWGERLYKIQERKLDRLNKGNEGIEQGVDLTLKILGALSDKDLLKVKSNMEIVDAEYKVNNTTEG